MLPLISAGVGALGSVLGGIFNSNSQDKANKQQQKFAEDMYNRQKIDNEAFWNKQNDYNSPQAQMDRLSKAGLNPNLVYGNGSAVNTAGDIKSPSAPSISPQSTRSGDAVKGVSGSLMNYFDVQMRQASLDNLRTQNTVMQEDAILKQAQQKATLASAGLNEYSLDFNKASRTDRLKRMMYDATDSANRSGISGLNYNFLMDNQDTRNKIYDTSLQDAIQTLSNKRQQGVGASIFNQAKQLDLDMAKMGVRPTDALWQRVLALILGKAGFKL